MLVQAIEAERRVYYNRGKKLGILERKEIGLNEGKEKGKKAGKLEVARVMLTLGLALDLIQKAPVFWNRKFSPYKPKNRNRRNRNKELKSNYKNSSMRRVSFVPAEQRTCLKG